MTLSSHFLQLIADLPEKEKASIQSNFSRKGSFTEFIHLIKTDQSLSYLNTQKEVQKFSRFALAAHLKNKLTFNELISLHILLAGWKEFIHEPHTYLHSNPIKEKNVRVKFPIRSQKYKQGMKKGVWKIDYKDTGLFLLTKQLSHSFKKFHRVIAEEQGGKERIRPILQIFFALNDQEWKFFLSLMRHQTPIEKSVHLIILPITGSYSELMTYYKSLMKFLSPVKMYFWDDFHQLIQRRSAVVIPSFSAIQNYMIVKAKTRNRKPLSLIPVFGEASIHDVEAMKRQGKSPLGLYYGAAASSKIEKDLNRHLYQMDHALGGPLSFIYHDIFHAVYDQEVKENETQALFRVVDILRKLSLEKPKLKKRLDVLITLLIDGKILISYEEKDNPFQFQLPNLNDIEMFSNIFGDLFYGLPIIGLYWTEEIIRYVIRDMVVNKAEWEALKIGRKDLREAEQKIYDEVGNGSS